MVKLITKFEVEDFAKWKSGFMAVESIRIAAGSKGWQIFLGMDNPKSVAVITEWDNLENAKKFYQSSALRDAQQKAGVSSKPEVFVPEPM